MNEIGNNLERYCAACLNRVEYIEQPEEIEKRFGLTFYCNADDEQYGLNETLSLQERTFRVNQKKQDFISEGTIDYKILKYVGEQIEALKGKIYIKEVTKSVNESSGEKIVAEKTISTHLDKIGFKDFRDRDMSGSYIQISSEVFSTIVSPLCPNLVNNSS